jgi:F-box-like
MSAHRLSLFALPPEIFIRIFGLLEGRQIARCGTVSRRPFSLLFLPEF